MGASSEGNVGPQTIKGTGVALIVLTSLVVGTRFAGAIRRPKDLKAEDYLLIVAYVFFLELSILYIYIAPAIFRIAALQAGTIPIYATVLQDSVRLQIVFFVTTPSLWLCLWMIKFSLLSMYKRLIVGKPYLIAWWVILVFCVLVQMSRSAVMCPHTLTQTSPGYDRLHSIIMVFVLELPCVVYRGRMLHPTRSSRRRHQLILRICGGYHY